MKKNALIGLALLFTLCLLIFACRKDIEMYVNDRSSAELPLLEAAKMWRLENVSSRSSSKLLVLDPLWKNAWTIQNGSGSSLLVVPAPEQRLETKVYSIRRFFVFSCSGSTVSGGKIVELFGINYNVNDHLDNLLGNINEKQIEGFNGAIIQYDIDYQFNSSQRYLNGKSGNKTGAIVAQSSSDQKATIAMALNSRKLSLAKGNSIMSFGGTCSFVMPSYVGFPFPALENCLYQAYKEETFDSGGCTTEITYTYMGASTCTGGTGNVGGSGSGGSGSGGSSQGSGSGTYGESPPYGGIVITDPCVIKATLNAIFNNNTIGGSAAEVRGHIGDTNGHEWGVNFLRSSPTGTGFLSGTPVEGGVGYVDVPFSWNSSSGYAVGGGHIHNADTAPSVDDVFKMIANLNNSAIPVSDQQFYKINAFQATFGPTTDFVVKVTNWTAVQNAYNTFKIDTGLYHQKVRDLDMTYKAINPTATEQEASIFSLYALLGASINIFKSPTAANTFVPIKANFNATALTASISNIPCN